MVELEGNWLFEGGNCDLYGLLIIGVIIFLLPKYLKFQKSGYANASGNGFFKTIFNKGHYGEFLTFEVIESIEQYGHILTNVYLPTAQGMTEVDLIYIHHTGVFVFESKNYDGWIFGNENHKEWTQSLPNKKKFKFFNPIWQNKGHIDAIKRQTDLIDEAFCSVIVFSERCTLKKIETHSPRVHVLKREYLRKFLKNEIAESKAKFKTEEVEMLALKLKAFTHMSEEVKKKHVERLEKTYKG